MSSKKKYSAVLHYLKVANLTNEIPRIYHMHTDKDTNVFYRQIQAYLHYIAEFQSEIIARVDYHIWYDVSLCVTRHFCI